MYSTLHDQCEESLVVDSSLPSATGTSAGVSQPADISSTPSNTKSIYSPSPAVSSTAPAPFNDPSCHRCYARFLHTPSGSPSARHQSLPCLQQPALSSRLSEPNIRSVTAYSASHHPLPNATETRHRRQRERHSQSFRHGTPVIPSPSSASFPADRIFRTACSATSFGREPREDLRAELLQEATAMARTHSVYTSIGYLHPSTAISKTLGPFEQIYYTGLTFNEVRQFMPPLFPTLK